MKKIILISLLLNFFFINKAFAYLDPGTGSIIVQALLGLLAAIAVALRLYWHKFLKLIGIRKKININLEDEKSQDTKN